jgi:acyl-coenzyme A thioesterase PaaI-like protein
LSAAVALFDEISTYGGTVVWDRSARPGVSIQLAARANSVLDVGSGDTVVVTTHLQKLGRTLGFVRVSIRDERGNLLVTGTHIKFMPMGPLFDLGLHPILQPLSIPSWEKLLDLRPHVAPAPAPLESVEQVFALRHVKPGIAEIDLHRYHANPIGGLHGGAGAMLSAHAALSYVNRNGGAGGANGLTLQELTLNLLSVIPAPSSAVGIQSALAAPHRVETSVRYCGKVALESMALFAPT